MFVGKSKTPSFRKILTVFILFFFISVSGHDGISAAAYEKDNLRKISTAQSDIKKVIANDLGVAKHNQKAEGRLEQRAIQSAIAYLIEQNDLDTIKAIGGEGTAALVKTRWGKFTAGHDLFKALIKNRKAVIAANVLDYNQIEGHLRAAMKTNSAVILEAARSQLDYALDAETVVKYIKDFAKRLKCTVPIVVHGDHIQYTQDLFNQRALLKAEYEALKGAGSYNDKIALEDVPVEVLRNVQNKLAENLAKERVAISGINERLLKAGFTSIAIDASTIFDEYAGDYVCEYYLANGAPEEQLAMRLEKEFYLPLEWGAEFLRADPDKDLDLYESIHNKVISDMRERNVPQADIDRQVERMKDAFGILAKEAKSAGFSEQAVIAAYDRIEKEIAAATIANQLPGTVFASLTEKQKLMLIPGSNAEETAFQLKKIDEIISLSPELAWLKGRAGKEIEVGHVDKRVPNPRNDNKLEAKLTHPMAVRVMAGYMEDRGLSFDVIATNNGSQHGSKYGADLKPVSKVLKISPFLTAELAKEAAKAGALIAQHGTTGSDLGEKAYQARNGIIKFNIATLYQQILLNALSALDDGVAPFDLPEYCAAHRDELIEGLSLSSRQKMLKAAADLKAGRLSPAVNEEDSDFMKFIKFTYAWGLKKNKISASSEEIKTAQLFAEEFKRSFKQMDPVLKTYGQATPVFVELTGGGDAPGLNTVIYYSLKRALENLSIMRPIYEGWKGGLDKELVAKSAVTALRIADVEEERALGGTVLKTSRTNPYSADRIAKGDNLQLEINIAYKMDADVDINDGGDDTNSGGANLHTQSAALKKEGITKKKIRVFGVPKTVDGDVNLPFGADTFGFQSMREAGAQYALKVREAAIKRHSVMVVEVMGRAAGYLTAFIGADAGATASLIPEKPVDLEELIRKIGPYYAAKGYGCVFVSEGAFIDPSVGNNRKWMDLAFQADPVAKEAYEECVKKFQKDKAAGKVDEFSHPKLERMGLIITAILDAGLKEYNAPVEEAGKIDYGNRGAKVCKADYEMCEILGKGVIDKALAGEDGQLLYVLNGELKSIPFEEIMVKDPKTGEMHIGTRSFEYNGVHKDVWARANLADGLVDESRIVFPKPEGEIAIPFGSGDTVDFDGIVKSVMPYARNIIRTAKNLKRVMTAEVK
ncbi:MAG: 6-phosphofructokinase, partial [Candidatus Omnitrophota bacterium]